ncbi:hypothetical protein BB561_002718 [Smittium simulii]|uniref:CDP-diacylglycerol--inositol 3-phosphatidyltransferase n=1 Tax=Smittium simulii TaxID=133385 RepID=A0A2T9YPI3_9FUNG|nr:hypothetical protein BB561_002718 [Smittium simulii]
MDKKKAPQTKSQRKMLSYQDIFHFVPNYIGYIRIFLASIAVCCMYAELPHLAVVSYALSELFDAADGYFARKLNQCSKFGEVLDMITDRCTTTVLLVYLAQLYKPIAVVYCFLISVDISSHYMQMYASLISGVSNHKQMDFSSYPILKAYYTNRNVLFWVCFGNEAFFILSYYQHYLTGYPRYFILSLLVISSPVFALKNIINIIQLFVASKQLATHDATLANKAK